MEMSDKVSIVLPCYKAERCIANMIRDVLAQSYTNWELIVVSNGKDQEAQLSIIKQFATQDTRISWHSIPIGGQGPARNYGMDHAGGKWITFVDADDDVDPTWLEKYMRVAHDEPEAVIAEYCHNYWMMKELQPCRLGCDESLYLQTLSDPKVFLPPLLQQEHIIAPPWNKLYSLSFLLSHGLRFRPEIYEDYIFNFQAAAALGTVHFIHDGGYRYNVSFDQGVMARYSPTHEAGGLLRVNAWCDALIAAGTPLEEVSDQKNRMLAHFSLEELLNTFRLYAPCSYADRIKIVKKQFDQPWMSAVYDLYREQPPALLDRMFYVFYRLRLPVICVLTFTVLHWIRRHLKGLSAVLLRHI